MKKFSFSLILLVISIISFSQEPEGKKTLGYVFEEKYDLAESYLIQENYSQALPILLQLDSIQPKNSNINYKIGLCYINLLTEKAKAIPYLEVAVLNVSKKYVSDYYKEKKAPPKTYYYLGIAYHLNYRFDDAIKAFENYKMFLNNLQEINDVNRRLEICRNAIEMVNNPIDVKFYNLGHAINTEYSEYAPVISADESILIFTSRRKGSTGGKLTPMGKYYEDIYVSYKKNNKWTPAVKIDTIVNTNLHDASLSLSADGQKLFIYRFDGVSGDIYESNLVGDKWSAPIKLEEPINTSAKESHACISPDGELLFFTSDREGGFGGTDIYICKKLPIGKWGNPQILSETINTPYNETAPYICPDGVTLYFSSEGHGTMGGYDIFKSTLVDEKWTPPENIGYPLNTTDDDFFFIPTADGKHAYYASPHFVGDYGEFDIYYIDLPQVKETPLRVVVGSVKNQQTKNAVPEAVINIYDAKTNEQIGIYRPNAKTGKFLFILEPGKNYNLIIDAKKYYHHSESLSIPDDASFSEVKLDIEIRPILINEKFTFTEINFDNENKKFTPESETKFSQIISLLTKNQSLVVEFSSYNIQDKSETPYHYTYITDTLIHYLIKQGIDALRLKIAQPIQPATLKIKPQIPKPEKIIPLKIEMRIVEIKEI